MDRFQSIDLALACERVDPPRFPDGVNRLLLWPLRGIELAVKQCEKRHALHRLGEVLLGACNEHGGDAPRQADEIPSDEKIVIGTFHRVAPIETDPDKVADFEVRDSIDRKLVKASDLQVLVGDFSKSPARL